MRAIAVEKKKDNRPEISPARWPDFSVEASSPAPVVDLLSPDFSMEASSAANMGLA